MTRKRLWILAPIVLGVLALVAPAGQDPEPTPVDAIRQEWADARRAQELSVDKCLGWIGQLETIAKESQDPAETYSALTLALSIASSRSKSSEVAAAGERALQRMIDTFIDDPERMTPILIQHLGGEERAELRRKVCEGTKSASVKAACLYARAMDLVEKEGASDGDRKHAIEILKEIERDYGKEMAYVGRTPRPFAEVVRDNLFQLENLYIGAIAPDIEAPDLEGVPFKLSDYRGKVVLLDFWGHW
jgi:hypothetical protein